MLRRLLVLLTALCAITTTAHADSMKEIVSASGVTGGVAVHLGCGDGTSTAALHSDDRLLVYGLDTDAAAVEKAKAHIASRNIYGQVSAETYDGKNLPFGDNIVNLIIVDDAADLSCAEILRVLVPKGVVLVKSGSELLKSSGLQAGRIGRGLGDSIASLGRTILMNGLIFFTARRITRSAGTRELESPSMCSGSPVPNIRVITMLLPA